MLRYKPIGIPGSNKKSKKGEEILVVDKGRYQD